MVQVSQLGSWPLRGLPGLGCRGVIHVVPRSSLSGPGLTVCDLAAQGAPGLRGPGIGRTQEEPNLWGPGVPSVVQVPQLGSTPLRGSRAWGRGVVHVVPRSPLSGPGLTVCDLAAQGAPGLRGPGIGRSQEEPNLRGPGVPSVVQVPQLGSWALRGLPGLGGREVVHVVPRSPIFRKQRKIES